MEAGQAQPVVRVAVADAHVVVLVDVDRLEQRLIDETPVRVVGVLVDVGGVRQQFQGVVEVLSRSGVVAVVRADPVLDRLQRRGDPVLLLAAEDLAKRLRLLMDVAVAESGTEPTYSQIAGYLHERGTNLSRSRWTYMVNGHRYVQDPAVFEGLAAFFDVDAAFLLGEDGAATPEKVSAQLDLVRSMRAAKVKSYAARTLGDISPKALHAITKFLDEEMTPTPEH